MIVEQNCTIRSKETKLIRGEQKRFRCQVIVQLMIFHFQLALFSVVSPTHAHTFQGNGVIRCFPQASFYAHDRRNERRKGTVMKREQCAGITPGISGMQAMHFESRIPKIQ